MLNVAQTQNLASAPCVPVEPNSKIFRNSILFCGIPTAVSLVAALLFSEGYILAFMSDVLQLALVAAATYLSFRNARVGDSKSRPFWILIAVGGAMWVGSLLQWTVDELWFRQPVPEVPVGDILLFVKLVPLSAAIVIGPHKSTESRFRAFGLLDVCILVVYFFYLYAFCVLAYRLLPGATDIYNYHFNIADAIGNQIFAIFAGIALLRVQGPWRDLYRIYFLAAASYCLASDLSDVAIDLGRYYSGSLFDVPLTLSAAALLAFAWHGSKVSADAGRNLFIEPPQDDRPSRIGFVSSQLAMIVTLSTPAIGLWLLTRNSSPQLFSFRLALTLSTIFVLTFLLSLKQHLLTNGLVGSLRNLSDTYASTDRFRNQLTQNEKLASLGESVALVANQIKTAMAIIRERSQTLTSAPDSESRIQSMAGKIGQYAHRTDALVENMLRFAKETSLELAPVGIKFLIEGALQLGRTSKLANVRVTLQQSDDVPQVLGDSSQLLHVFLQIISNAVDALEEVGGGSFDISIAPVGPQVRVEFADSGPGIKQPEHVFEPFYTTKPVGKGTGLGLSTCYGIIQKHQGEISCSNRPEGGAVFTVFLPAATQTDHSGAEQSSVAAEGVR